MNAKEYRKTPDWEEAYNSFKEDPILFGRVLFPKLARLPTPEFHRELSGLYMNKSIDRINVIAPRDHAKTSLVSQVFGLHHLVYEPEDPFLIIVSKTGKHSKRVIRSIKMMMNEPRFQTMYGHIVRGCNSKTADKWNEEQIILPSGHTVYATGSGQQIRGIKEGYWRPSLIILDDPEDKENTKTADRMDANFRYVTEELIPARRKGGRVFVVGTPLNQRSMVMRLKDSPNFVSRHYSAECEDPNLDGFKEEKTDTLWPEKWSWDDLMKEKNDARSRNELSSYYQEYCCKIIPDEKRLFKEEYIKYYTGDIEHKAGKTWLKYQEVNKYGEPLGEEKYTNVNIFSGIDPATSTKDTADYFVIFHVAVTPNNERFILPYFRGRVTPTYAIDQVVAEYKKWNPVRMSIETSGQQETMRDVLRNMDGVHIPGLSVAHNPREKKEKRHLELLEPWLSRKRVYMQRDMKDLLSEMQMHPKGKHDDLLDGMYYAFKHARPPKAEKSKEKRREDELREHQRHGGSDQSWMLA